jgi:4-diphosphocytidyl-2-C-methyl-D-erythritol kinase
MTMLALFFVSYCARLWQINGRVAGKTSPCKVNLLLNILGKRADGFHELETVLYPVRVFDRLIFARAGHGIQLSCNAPGLPTDARNLVIAPRRMFLEAAKSRRVCGWNSRRISRWRRVWGAAAATRRPRCSGLNELFGGPLSPEQLQRIAASLGSDVPFFLQDQPALATGRGEQIQPLGAFPALSGAAFLLIHPGFGIATAWAYQRLARFPPR